MGQTACAMGEDGGVLDIESAIVLSIFFIPSIYPTPNPQPPTPHFTFSFYEICTYIPLIIYLYTRNLGGRRKNPQRKGEYIDIEIEGNIDH